jgi:tetratricopeptide (TPR) repeat protein
MRAILLLLVAMVQFAAAEWTRVSSPQFEILSDAGKRDTRTLTRLLAQISAILPNNGPRTVRIFLFANDKEFRPYRDNSEGFFATGVERDYMALHAGPVSNRVVFHEFTHLVLSHASAPLPLWFDEGTAELYSNLEVSAHRVRIGDPIDTHLATLQAARWLTGAELASIVRTSPDYKAGLFYAESWALVHMLNLAPAWRDGMPRFILALSDGHALPEAFESAFGRSIDAAVDDLHRYVNAMRPVTVDAPPPAPFESRTEPVPGDQVTLALIDLALETHRSAQARTLVERFARQNPHSPETPAIRASLALAEGRKDDALADFDTAIRMGTRDASVYLEYAMIERERHAPRESVDRLLEKAAGIDPNFGQAQFLLGVNLTDDGNFAAAIDRLRMAVRARPLRSDYWHALAYAQFKARDPNAALVSARRAVAVAGSTTEEDMAQALISLVETTPDPPPVRRADFTPPSWTNPKGDSRLEGTLERVDCDGDAASLLIRGGDGSAVLLHVRHPRQVEIRNAATHDYQFSCGPQQAHVAVEYNAADFEVTSITFRP